MDERIPWNLRLAADYDRVAKAYAEVFSDELSHKPFDRDLLGRFAHIVSGPVLELGCGPGQVAAYLQARGLELYGSDLFPRMVDIARRLHPDISFEVADMRKLPYARNAFGGIVCFYALIHLERREVPVALREMARVLRSGGTVLLAVHGGDGEAYADEWFGQPVSLSATLFGAKELADLLRQSGFQSVEVLKRPPYDFEHQTERLYAVATKPARLK